VATQKLLNTISNTSMNVISGGEVPVATFGPFSATNPNSVVQHAGFYYFMAARCAEERWAKFKAAEQAVASNSLQPSMPTAAASTAGGRGSPLPPSLSSKLFFIVFLSKSMRNLIRFGLRQISPHRLLSLVQCQNKH
jgi:hypothetical protein